MLTVTTTTTVKCSLCVDYVDNTIRNHSIPTDDITFAIYTNWASVSLIKDEDLRTQSQAMGALLMDTRAQLEVLTLKSIRELL